MKSEQFDKKTPSPSPNGSNGPIERDIRGRFSKGNKGGPGNPHAKKIEQLRSALIKAVSIKDIRGIIRAMIDAAKGGDVQAAKLILDRCLGKAEQPISPGDENKTPMFIVGVREIEPERRNNADND